MLTPKNALAPKTALTSKTVRPGSMKRLSMTSSPWKALLIVALSAGALACITINVYFPEAAVRDLSEKIESAVAEEAAKAAASEGSTPESSASGEESAAFTAVAPAGPSDRIRQAVLPWVLGWSATEVSAQPGSQQKVAAPEITNPAIRKIVESRGQRVPEIQPFKQSGVLGENKDALLEIRNLDSLALPDRAKVQKLVKAENADRERMFKEIAAATGTDLSQLPQIFSTYAATLRDNAEKGEWIQMPDGTWKQK